MKISKCLLVALPATLILMTACKNRNESAVEMVMDSTRPSANTAANYDTSLKTEPVAPESSKAAEAKANDSIIRTAELKFKVKKVYQATTAIEDIATHFGGFVTSSNLSSNKDQVSSSEISADSSLETTLFTVTNNMVLRDKVNFSTVNLTIYQRQGIKREVIANTKNIEPYKPSLIKRLAESIQTGWVVLEEIILFFFSIWGIILLTSLLFLIYRKYLRNTK